jgi:cytochrome c553
MSQPMRSLPWIVALLMSGLSAAQAAGDPQAGKAKASTCMGCHGIPAYTNVYPTYHVPKLGGQSADYIVSALKAYKSGDRNHPTMHAQAMSLNDQDMADIAAFITQAPKAK